MRPAFRLDDKVQTCQYDPDTGAYNYGPVCTIIKIHEHHPAWRIDNEYLDDPVYDLRNDASGRISMRYEWELVRTGELLS